MTTRITDDGHGNSTIESTGSDVTRATHGAEPGQSTSNLRPEGQGQRVETRNGNMHTVQTVGPDGNITTEDVPDSFSISAADHRADRGPGILASAVDAFGIPTPAERMTKDTLVTLPDGFQTSLAVAEQMGYVSRNPDGTYRDGPGDATNTTDGDNNTNESGPVPFDDAAESVFRDIADAYQGPLASALVEAAIDGRLEEQLRDLAGASDGKFTPDALRTAVQQIEAATRAQADEVVTSILGGDPQEFYDWLSETNPQHAQHLMRSHISTRDPNVWREAVRQYAQEVPPTVETLQAHGYQTRTTPDGVDLVTINGAEYRLEVAAKLGLI